LAKHPQYVEKVANELSEYTSIDDISLRILEKLPFLNAVVREGLRMYPPTGGPFGRLCPPQGINIGGYHIPGGVSPAQVLLISDYCMS
jgi:cytochrome P450